MQENEMPAIEVEAVVSEPAAYELAFHILPTVAEGEVEGIFDTLKKHITQAGGQVFDTEAPERFDLAYEVVRYLEGRNRGFNSAYFGWIRFHLEPRALEAVSELVEAQKDLLRYLLIRLTKEEEQAPFRFHEALAETRVKTIGNDEEVVVPEGDVVVADEVVATDVVVDDVVGEEVKE